MKKYIKAAITSDMPEWIRKAIQLNRNTISALGWDIQNSDFVDHVEPGQDYIPIYKIDRTVYIPGVNDNDTEKINGRYRTLGKVSKSTLNNIADDVYFMIPAEKPSKKHYKDPRNFEGNPFDGYGYAGQQYSKYDERWHTPEGRDKSGYKIPNPEQHIRDFYSKPGNYPKLADKINQIYEELLEVKQELFDFDFRKSLKYPTDYNNALGSFAYSVQYYNEIIGILQQFPQRSVSGKQSSVDRIFSLIRQIQYNINNAERYINY